MDKKLEKIIDLKLDASDRDAERHGLIQYDYGQILRIHGLDFPPAVEIQFSYREKGGVTENRIGTTKDGVTEVQIPDKMLKNNGTTQDYAIWVFVYVTDATSGNTVYRIKLYVDSRPAPGEIGEDPDESHILDEAVNAVNAAADRAETAEAEARSAADSATAAAESARKSAEAVAQKKNTAISVIQNRQAAAEKAITDHTDAEIARLDRETQASEDRLTKTIRTANDTKEAAENTISEARRVKESLDISVQNATKEKEAVEASTSTANAAKKNLDQSTADANVAKTALDKTIQSADDQNTSLGEKIETSKQLKTDLQTAGEKATQDIQTAGSEQLGKMQAVAEEFTADREQITTNKEDIGSLKEDTASLQKRQNVLVGSETGNPVSCDDAFAAPLCGLTVYGRSTQDGTPSPDNPVPIVSAGDGGSVAVKVTGANILEGTKPGVKSTVLGITYTTYENGVLITGTAANISSMRLHEDMTHRLTHGIYYLTTKGLSPSVTLNFFFVGRFSSDIQNKEITLTKNVDYSLMLQILKGATLNTTVQVALTRNKIATYSPYREQLLTVGTPSGLPGIPVTSGGNYTDQSGQQWVCDEVDFGKSVKVQRIDKGAFDSTKTLAEQNVILAAPIEKPLTPDEIAAYKALIAYGPDTVVQASDGAGIKLDYQRDVNLVVKNLEDAIASMTTT
nr:MAG TPA: chromosome segregation ATPase [Caudoviricetes sp.]